METADQEREDEVLRRMLKTPHKPRKPNRVVEKDKKPKDSGSGG